MPSKEISFWINERWYDALSKHLKNETLCRLFEGAGADHSDDTDVTLCFRLCRPVCGYSSAGGIPAPPQRWKRPFRGFWTILPE